jgi:predicted TIM-barrel fold metal-dependent hydrolase
MVRAPRLVAVIAHLGMNQTERFLELLDRYPSLCLEASFTRFPGYPGAPEFDPDVLAPYAGRVLFGSDFPNIPFTYADQVAAWWEVPWVRANADAFFRENARRLLPEATPVR